MTDAQRRAADPGASVWVSASAGTGKTKVLTDRVLNLLLAGTAPGRILCLTFTRAAAAEMRTRIARTLADWAVKRDDKLDENLGTLTGSTPDEALRGRARRLFATVLDEPGGMKIMTIHAFCQSVLRRFPLEAGLAPHFTTMEERDAAELMEEAQRAVLGRARGGSDPDLADAVARVATRVSYLDVPGVFSEIARERTRIRRILGPGHDVAAAEARIRARLDLGQGETTASLIGATCDRGNFDREALMRAAKALLSSEAKTDREKGGKIARWLDADRDGRIAGFDDYLGAFFKNKGAGDRFKDLATKAVREVNPAAVDALEAEVARLDVLRARLRAAAIAEASVALLRLGGALLDEYERRKATRALLDYDDLIYRCRDLLRQQGAAAWVLYKLDGGIDHVLIDEAQDTNPEQWEVVEALAEEYFAGAGMEPATERTLFAVGDPKQSIFSFQRADPDAFDRFRALFADRVTASDHRWDDVPLDVSFRSTAAVLRVVDAVFATEPARDGVIPRGKVLRHGVHREGQAGLVELWPLAPEPEKEALEPWEPPVTAAGEESPRQRVGRLIASRIRGWLDEGERLESQARPVEPGDIMVLLPRRGDFMDLMVRALKERGVEVAGADRMVLTEQIAVMDLIALGRFLLLPEDDLTLAALLKSPLFGLDDDGLYRLARERKGSLWRALQEKHSDDPVFAPAHEELADLLGRADYVPPYELYAELLSARDGRRRLLARLGHEAEDPIEEFLALALAYERSHTPSLQGFLHWLAAGEAQIKRDLEHTGRDQVRVITVHGAKGLEAPIVFLPDTTRNPAQSPRDALLWARDPDAVLWPGRKDEDDPATAALREAAARRAAQEDRRLLYVALTRAADRLYVCGWPHQGNVPEGSWYDLVRRGLEADPEAEEVPEILAGLAGGWEGAGLRLSRPQTAPAKKERKEPQEEAREELPSWAREPAPMEPPPRPLAPSRPADAPAVSSPVGPVTAEAEAETRFRRGLIIHSLLEYLPDAAVEYRRDRCRRYLARMASDLPEPTRRAIEDEVMAVLEAPEFAAFFAEGSRAEVPLSGIVEGRRRAEIISGQVDRLVVTADRVLVLDYKSNRPPPTRESEVPKLYLTQMASYRALLSTIYPNRDIACALLWTDGPRLMPIPSEVLDEHAP